jgi:hypothetical protein
MYFGHHHLVRNGVLPEARAYPKEMMLILGIRSSISKNSATENIYFGEC